MRGIIDLFRVGESVPDSLKVRGEDIPADPLGEPFAIAEEKRLEFMDHDERNETRWVEPFAHRLLDILK